MCADFACSAVNQGPLVCLTRRSGKSVVNLENIQFADRKLELAAKTSHIVGLSYAAIKPGLIREIHFAERDEMISLKVRSLYDNFTVFETRDKT